MAPMAETLTREYRSRPARGRHRRSGQVVPSGLHIGQEAPPQARGDGQNRAVGVFGVADGDGSWVVTGDLYTATAAIAAVAGFAPGQTDLDAVSAAVAAVAGLVPAVDHFAFHCSATSRIRARLAARGSASAWTRTKILAARRTSARVSVVTSSTVSISRTSGAPSPSAMQKDRPSRRWRQCLPGLPEC